MRDRSAREFLTTVTAELATLTENADYQAIHEASQLILAAESRGGRLHFTGVGKSEYVARYCAASFSSTGTPAYLLHTTEAVHGSFGQLGPSDVVVAISNSGETAELLVTAQRALDLGHKLIAVARSRTSSLARMSDLFIEVRVSSEGDRLSQAPRASVLAQMMLLQAISVELQETKEFDADQFRNFHPGGSLGNVAAVVQHGPARRRAGGDTRPLYMQGVSSLPASR